MNRLRVGGVQLLLAMLLGGAPVSGALALTLDQTYYVPMGEGELLTTFQAVAGNTTAAVSPIQNRIAITIAVSGTQIVWDQWENGYEGDLATPTAVCSLSSPYTPASGPSGDPCTQIWGDNNPTNGCAAIVLGSSCVDGSDDVLSVGDVIRLQDAVTLVTGQRDSSQVFFDGRDRFGVTRPVVMTRGAIPGGAGALLAGATEAAAETSPAWSTSFQVPIGQNLTTNTEAFEGVWLFIMPSAAGTVTVGSTNYNVTQGQSLLIQGIPAVGTPVTSTVPIQVHIAAFDAASSYELRSLQLIPVSAFRSDYLSPIGTSINPASGAGCTEFWAYNPNSSAITINVDLPAGSVPDATFTVNAGAAASWPSSITDLLGKGARLYTTGSPAPDFLPLQIVDCTTQSPASGSAYDWGVPLVPTELLTTSLIVGGAAGCTNATPSATGSAAICSNSNINAGAQASRNPVWVTPTADTTLYVDKDGSGIKCPGGVGAEETVAATALGSYRFVDDPVRGTQSFLDTFASQSYARQDGTDPPETDWASNWIEENDDASASTGDVFVSTGGSLTFDAAGLLSNEAIRRKANLLSFPTAVLEFDFVRNSSINAGGAIVYEVRRSPLDPWITLGLINRSNSATSGSRKHDISPYIGAETEIRFRINQQQASSVAQISFDNVRISDGRGDYDMTGARIATCNGVTIAGAYGQDPSAAGNGSDTEGPDFGTLILPFGSAIRVEKSVNVTAPVTPGTTVNYTYLVHNDGQLPLDIVPGDPGGGGSGVGLTDDKCSTVTPVLNGGSNIGDTNTDGLLDNGEVWQYTCSATIDTVTTNVVTACGLPQSSGASNLCDNDEVTVDVLPTAVTLGEINLDPVAVEDYLEGLGVAELDAAALLQWLRAWDPTAAAALAGADRAALLAALRSYLDPDGDGAVVLFRWETLEQRGTVGFYAERRDGTAWTPINHDMLPGLVAAPMGAEYWLADPDAAPGEALQYRLIEIEATGTTREYGPFDLTVGSPVP